MNESEVNRFNKLYERHLKNLKLQGKSEKTIDAYSRAIRRVRDYFDCCPDKLKPEQLENYCNYPAKKMHLRSFFT